MIFLSFVLRNFFLRQDCLSDDVPPRLAQPFYVALGRAPIWGLYPDWFEGFVKYWSQKQAQSGNIHSIILAVHVGWQSSQKYWPLSSP